MNMQIAILGRQHKISLAELEALFGAKNIIPLADFAALVNSDQSLPQQYLGGTIKSAKLLTRLEGTTLSEAFIYLQQTIPELLDSIPEGKLQLGISVYGFTAKRDWLLKQTLALKKIIRNAGRSVRIIENKKEALETAQVLYNKLTSPLGLELLLLKDEDDTLVAQTTAVQDINAYAARDYGRPMRDAYVGMLPPKLAQIMINLSMNKAKPNRDNRKLQILDPFCGTGVVLQEALLMGYEVFGSDLSQKMIDYTTSNLAWLKENYSNLGTILTIEQADATIHKWVEANIIDSVVSETYLGKPLTSLPSSQKLNSIMNETNAIVEKFLKNIAPQLNPGTILCLALPAWNKNGCQRSEVRCQRPGCTHQTLDFRHHTSNIYHLKVLDHLSDLGYNRLEFVHATNSELIYHRKDQVVARELTILKKI